VGVPSSEQARRQVESVDLLMLPKLDKERRTWRRVAEESHVVIYSTIHHNVNTCKPPGSVRF
jgi:hypothetical protein